jgi:hypothetical protein
MNTDNLTPHEQKQIVIHQLRMERLRLAFTANLYDYKVKITDHTRQASQRRKEIDTLIEQLSAPPKYFQMELFPVQGEIRA